MGTNALSTREDAERLAKKNRMAIVPVDDSYSELHDITGKVITSDLTIRLWHRIVELFKK